MPLFLECNTEQPAAAAGLIPVDYTRTCLRLSLLHHPSIKALCEDIQEHFMLHSECKGWDKQGNVSTCTVYTFVCLCTAGDTSEPAGVDRSGGEGCKVNHITDHTIVSGGEEAVTADICPPRHEQSLCDRGRCTATARAKTYNGSKERATCHICGYYRVNAEQ